MGESRALTQTDVEKAGSIVISTEKGTLSFEKVGEMMDFAKLMAVSDIAVRKHLRGNPGACLAIVVQANEWGLSPFSVANKSFMVDDHMAYESQLLHAVVERRAPLLKRLRFEYEGVGGERLVAVIGHLKGEVEPLVYRSPMIKDIKVKNSPLWFADPDQQLSYYGARAWARRYVPDVLLGVYSDDELDGARHLGAANAKDVSPIPSEETLHHRLSLKAAAAAGFNPSAIADTMAEVSGRPANPAPVNANPVSVTPDGEVAAQDGRGPRPIPFREDAGSPAASVSAATNDSPDGETAAPAVNPQTAAQGEAADPYEPAADPPQDSAPVHSAASSARHVAPAPEAGAATPDAAPAEPAAFAPPPLPTDGKGYLDYVKASLLDPGLNSESALRLWWGSQRAKKLRNGLANLTTEMVDEAKAAITARIKALNADQG